MIKEDFFTKKQHLREPIEEPIISYILSAFPFGKNISIKSSSLVYLSDFSTHRDVFIYKESSKFKLDFSFNTYSTYDLQEFTTFLYLFIINEYHTRGVNFYKDKVYEREISKTLNSIPKFFLSDKEIFNRYIRAISKYREYSIMDELIENKLFAGELESFVAKQTVDPKLQAEIFQALVSALEKEGTSADFSGYIGKNVPKEALLAALGQQVIAKLKEKDVLVGEFIGGVQLKLHDRRMILDISNEALRELIGR
ncbi:hypothetical protein EBU94_09465, partial [bacterium]|nr:hypothetical protein [bacterium]